MIKNEIKDWRVSVARDQDLSYTFMLGRLKFWLSHYRKFFPAGYKKRICQMIGAISFNLSLNNENTKTKRS